MQAFVVPALLPRRPLAPHPTFSTLSPQPSHPICSASSPSQTPSPKPSSAFPPRPSSTPSSTSVSPTSTSASPPSLYTLLSLPASPAPSTLPHSALHAAYIAAARRAHPDAGGSAAAFDALAAAWAVLGDEELRRVYDAAGMPGVEAVRSVAQRAEEAARAFPDGIDGEQMDFLSETGALATGLLGAAGAAAAGARIGATAGDDGFEGMEAREDACPRSVEEAVWSILENPDMSARYYALWWVYRFKVSAATQALVVVLRTSVEQTALGGYGLRRRAALALGAVAGMDRSVGGQDEGVLEALQEALSSRDYYLRYRAAEAIAGIALREQRRRDALGGGADAGNASEFPESVLGAVVRVLWKGADALAESAANKSGYEKQEGLFDLEKLDPEVAEKLRLVFEARRKNEDRSRRTTMTPQLGVDAVDTEKDEPYEWLLKALAAGAALRGGNVDGGGADLVETVRAFLEHPFPLVRYAAHKALYTLTGDREHAEALVAGLDYGVEHHYSQRVLIRDLGDLGYAPAAAAVAESPMVENSFKILALKSMLAKHNHDAQEEDVRNVLTHMDSLL